MNRAGGTPLTECPLAADVDAFLGQLALPLPSTGDAGLVDLIRSLEDLKAAAAAVQARATVVFKRSRVARQTAAGLPTDQVGRDVGAQVALARRESP